MYKHQGLLQENNVDISTLPPSLQKLVAQFDSQQYDLEEEEADEESIPTDIRAMRAELKKLDHSLYRHIKNILDQEASEELNGEELKAAILHEHFQTGHTRVPVATLKQAGYPFSRKVSINETVGSRQTGNYRLTKRRYDAYCTIKPLT